MIFAGFGRLTSCRQWLLSLPTGFRAEPLWLSSVVLFWFSCYRECLLLSLHSKCQFFCNPFPAEQPPASHTPHQGKSAAARSTVWQYSASAFGLSGGLFELLSSSLFPSTAIVSPQVSKSCRDKSIDYLILESGRCIFFTWALPSRLRDFVHILRQGKILAGSAFTFLMTYISVPAEGCLVQQATGLIVFANSAAVMVLGNWITNMAGKIRFCAIDEWWWLRQL